MIKHISTLLFIAILAHVCAKKPLDQKTKHNVMKKLLEMGSISNLNELKDLGIHVEKVNKPFSLIGRNGNIKGPAPIMAGDLKDATPGKCDPKPVCISNPLISGLNSSQLAFPPCINIHRCDGCCPTNEKCVAVKTHEVNLQKVGIIEFESENSAKYTDSMVKVLNHTECECQCQWGTDADCQAINPNFVKSLSFCECICPEELRCGPLHEFDKETCSCKCKRSKFRHLEQVCKAKNFKWNDIYCKCDAIKNIMSAKEVKLQD